MNTNEIRRAFINFFTQRDYVLVQRDSLVSPEFPSTFMPSGGHHFHYEIFSRLGKEYVEKTFRGSWYERMCTEERLPLTIDEKKPANHLIVQPCFRHWDANTDDGNHLSLFEGLMVGCSDGYERKRVIRNYVEFLTHTLGIPQHRILVTVFGGGKAYGLFDAPRDQESITIISELGFTDSQIFELSGDLNFAFSKEEHFGGPRVEFFWDSGKASECYHCKPGTCECGKFIELFVSSCVDYIVLDRKVMKVDRRFVGASLGLERITQCVQQKERIYQIDSIQPIIDLLTEKTVNGNHEKIADMTRSLIFLIHDGAYQLSSDDDRTRMYRKCLKTFIKEIGVHASPEIYLWLFDLVRRLYGKYYQQLPSSSLCVKEVEKQKHREIQEGKEKKKHERRIQKKIFQ